MSVNQQSKGIHYSGRFLTGNVIYNLVGQLLPMVAALAAIPFIISHLGTERFGVLTIIWMVVGYFSLFDMGIGRATTKFTAEYISSGRLMELPSLIWNSLYMLIGLGILGGLILALLTPLLIYHVLKIPPNLQMETLKVFYAMAVSIPFVLGTSGARGVLEAQQRFLLVNAIKLPASLINFLAPIFVLIFANNLYYISVVLVAGRIIFFILYLIFCLNSVPNMFKLQRMDLSQVKILLGFGGWLTVSNIIGPLMTYMDRFVIGALISLSAVTYYATPYDVVTRLWVFSGSLLGVLFPVFSAYSIGDNQRNLEKLYKRSLYCLLVILLPIIVIICVMAEPLLTMWLGAEFARHSTIVTQILSVGVLICALSQVPFSVTQAMGRPDVTAKLHLIELPLYLGVMWLAIPKLGIVGAAVAWLLRILVDAFFLFWFSFRMKWVSIWPDNHQTKLILINALLIVSAFVITSFMDSIIPKIAILVVFVLTFIYCATTSLAGDDKENVLNLLTRWKKTAKGKLL